MTNRLISQSGDDDTPPFRALREAPGPAVEPTRGDVVWSRKWLILLAAILGAGFAGLAAWQQPVVYTAQSTVRVSLLQSQNIGAQNAEAANEFAAQYAQIADADPIINAAAKRTGVSSTTLRASVSASPLNKYNVIAVSAKAPTSAGAAERADAVAKALVGYVDTSYAASLKSASKSSASQLRSLNAAIKQAQADVQSRSAAGDAASIASARSLLSSLISLRQNLYLAPISELAQARPTLTVLNSPTVGVAQNRHLLVYGVAGFVVAGVIAAELCVVSAHFRSRRRR